MTWQELLDQVTLDAADCRDVRKALSLCEYKATEDTGDNMLENARMTPWAFGQMCQRLGIPTSYMNICPSQLRETNILYWLTRSPRDVMIRFREDTVRALVSDKYGPLDDHKMVKLTMDKADDQLDIVRASCSDSFTELVTLDKLGPLGVRDLQDHEFRIGLILHNSMVGRAAFRARLAVLRQRQSCWWIYLSSGSVSVSKRHIYIDEDQFLLKLEAVLAQLNTFRVAAEQALESALIDKVKPVELARLKHKMALIFGAVWVKERWPGFEQDSSLTKYTLASIIAEEANRDGISPEDHVYGSLIAGRLVGV